MHYAFLMNSYSGLVIACPLGFGIGTLLAIKGRRLERFSEKQHSHQRYAAELRLAHQSQRGDYLIKIRGLLPPGKTSG